MVSMVSQFNLGYNSLSGVIPTELGEVVALKAGLKLENNKLSGSIPVSSNLGFEFEFGRGQYEYKMLSPIRDTPNLPPHFHHSTIPPRLSSANSQS